MSNSIQARPFSYRSLSFYDMRRLRDDRITFLNIHADNSPGTSFYIVTDPNIPDNDRSCTDQAAVTDHRAFPVHFSNRHILINPTVFPDNGI